ncbi:phosphate acetyltransferase [Nitratifractor sp.]|uniref:phosphate acetyltransferase n=1 Tax=Nitratifractor sp. TaxID=2268144 RepID=UPI0025F87A6D|nr:phosphate acetyltransferase [Nitratifractor sp.]
MSREHPVDSVYITSREPGAGSMVLAMGLMELLRRHYRRIALYRPLAFNREHDGDMETLLKHFGLEQSLESTQGIPLEEAERLLAGEGISRLAEAVLERYEALRGDADFVLCLGTRMERLNRQLGMDLNIELAKNLSAPVAGIFSMTEEVGNLEEPFALWSRAIRQEGAEIFLLCANHCSEEAADRLASAPWKSNYDFPIFCLPRLAALEHLSLLDIMEKLPVEMLAGSETQKENDLNAFRLGTMELGSLLKEQQPYELVITASDRADMVAGLLLSAQSVTTPMNGGVLLCGKAPDPALSKLLEGLDEIPTPVLYTKKYEHEVLPILMEIKPSIRAGNRRKIDMALQLFAEYVEGEVLQKRLSTMPQEIMTPAMFRMQLFERARSDLKRILLPEIEDDRILRAAESLLRRKVVRIVLVGENEEITRRSKKLGIDLSGAEILDPTDESLRQHFAELYYQERKAKGVTRETALDRVSANKTLFATMALYDGRADGLVSGAIHSTRDTILPALQVIKTAEGYPLASSCFFMCLPTRVLVYADCAVNPDPTADELAVIALETVETAEKFGIDPRVAMLSYSTGESGVGADVEKVRRATEILQRKRPDLPVAGPIQYDAAIEPEVAKIKMPDNPVAGHATIFIFPDLDTGNIAYKAVQRSAGAVAVGPVMQGLRKPVNDLSRGCTVDDIIDTVAITAIQAQEKES